MQKHVIKQGFFLFTAYISTLHNKFPPCLGIRELLSAYVVITVELAIFMAFDLFVWFDRQVSSISG